MPQYAYGNHTCYNHLYNWSIPSCYVYTTVLNDCYSKSNGLFSDTLLLVGWFLQFTSMLRPRLLTILNTIPGLKMQHCWFEHHLYYVQTKMLTTNQLLEYRKTKIELIVCVYVCVHTCTQAHTLIHDPPWEGSEKWPMLINQTRIQITVITLDNCWPNSSSFFCSGVFTSSSWSFIAVLILPMAVFKPVPTTTPRALPEATFVPCVYYVHHLCVNTNTHKY